MSIEHEKLKAEALPLGLFVGVHREWKHGQYYVSLLHEPAKQIAKFATAAEVRQALTDFKHGKIEASSSPRTTELTEVMTLRQKAGPLGIYVGEHKVFDPCRGGPYFLVPKRRNKDDGLQPTLLRFATAEQVEAYLNREAEHYAA